MSRRHCNRPYWLQNRIEKYEHMFKHCVPIPCSVPLPPIPAIRFLAYVTNSGTPEDIGNTVSVIDTEKDKVIDTITVGET
ncbi:hypothetical protein CN354_14295 [Bacillus cereus]|nr:hypothetical protein CN354_14295 [Bacillus cereus]WJE55494.1 hypothetical protein QRE66_28495 [Bacillus cereus]